MTDTAPSPAPLRFALVPVEPIERPSFCDHGESRQCCWDYSGTKCCQADRAQSERDASPGNDLLQRIVRARDNLQSVRNCRGAEACDVMDAVNALADVLNELGGGDD